MSHLFSQGVIAAETFLRDEGFRVRLQEILMPSHPTQARLLGDPVQRPEPSRFEIVFAIITEASRKDWPRALPFFSQLNLVRSAQRLRMLGFQVSLCRIGEEG